MPTHDILSKLAPSGPMAVEAELCKIVGVASQGHSRSKKYELFLEELQRRNEKEKKNAIFSFLSGYFHHQAGAANDSPFDKNRHLQQALSNYQTFLGSTSNGTADMRYFAQWQIGIGQQLHGKPWSAVEAACLKCLEYDRIRAESLQDVLVFRYTQREWRIAFIYSSYCMNQFLGKPPANRFWYVDKAFYDWKILRYHIPILIAIRKKEEARALLDRLTDYLQKNPASFTERDCVSIDNLKNRMEEAV